MLEVSWKSQRVKQKNFKPFANEKSLLNLKIKQLKEADCFDKIYISSDSDLAKEIAHDEGASFLYRDPYMCGHEARLYEYNNYMLNTVPGDPIVAWTMTTAPLFDDYSSVVSSYHKMDTNLFDSLIPFLRFFMKGNSLTSLINKNYSKNWINSALDHQLLIKRESSSLKRRLRFDFFHLSLPALLRYEDRCSMAFSIEARTPFLDYRLVEEVQNSPSEYLIKDGLSKSFIRDAVYRFIPPLVFDRSDKKGYPTPSSDWIDASLDKIKSLFEGDCYVYKYIDEENFKNLLSSKDIKFKGNEIWRIIFLELWFKEFFDKDAERDVFLKNKRFI